MCATKLIWTQMYSNGILVAWFFSCPRVIPMHLRLILVGSFRNEVKAIKAKGDSKDVSVLLAPQKGSSKLQSNFTWTLCSTGGYPLVN